MDADGSNPTRLTNNAGNDWDPAWSPDGSRIAFISDRDGTFDIYVIGANGGNTIRINDNVGNSNSWSLAWSPDGSRVAYFHDDNNRGYGDIYTRRVDVNGRVLVDRGNNWDPAWSPDGRRIAFVSGCDIAIRDATGDNWTKIFNSSGCDHQFKPTRSLVWSPNGRRIAFYFHGPGPNFDIYVVDTDGRNPTRLTEHSADDESPVWSPDSRRLAFHSDREGNFDIYVMDADGQNPTRFTFHDADDMSPVWSPDGSQIAFVSFRLGNREIYVVDVD